jgi:hypothetical protein
LGPNLNPPQVHDFNPGIAENGLFWTTPVPASAVALNLGQGTASFRMTDLAIPDYHDFLNSIGLADPPIQVQPATVSFDTRWYATGPVTRLRDEAKQFVGEFRESRATIAWSAEEPATNFSFVSDAASTTTNPAPAVLGHERNGKFFS